MHSNKLRSATPLVKLGLGLGLALAPMLSTAAEVPNRLSWSTNIDARYDENVGLAPDSASKRETLTTHLEAGLHWQAHQSATQEVSLAVAPFYNAVTTLTDLSNYGVEVRFNAQQQLGEAFTSPFVATEVFGMPPAQMGIYFGAPALG